MDNVIVIGQFDAIRNGLERFLQEDAVNLVQCDDTQVHIAESLECEPTLAFVEVDSAAGDSFEVLSQLRHTPQAPFRIIAVCNHYDSHTNELCLAMGADFAIPQTDDGANVGLLIRGLLGMRDSKPRTSKYRIYSLASGPRSLPLSVR